MITSRTQVTDMIQSAKILKGIKWSHIAEVVGQSKEWSTAACLGQMAMTKQQAEAVGELLELTDEAIAWLQIVPYKGSLPTEVCSLSNSQNEARKLARPSRRASLKCPYSLLCHLDVEPLYLRQHAAITNILTLAEWVIIYADWYKLPLV